MVTSTITSYHFCIKLHHWSHHFFQQTVTIFLQKIYTQKRKVKLEEIVAHNKIDYIRTTEHACLYKLYINAKDYIRSIEIQSFLNTALNIKYI